MAKVWRPKNKKEEKEYQNALKYWENNASLYEKREAWLKSDIRKLEERSEKEHLSPSDQADLVVYKKRLDKINEAKEKDCYSDNKSKFAISYIQTYMDEQNEKEKFDFLGLKKRKQQKEKENYKKSRIEKFDNMSDYELASEYRKLDNFRKEVEGMLTEKDSIEWKLLNKKYAEVVESREMNREINEASRFYEKVNAPIKTEPHDYDKQRRDEEAEKQRRAHLQERSDLMF